MQVSKYITKIFLSLSLSFSITCISIVQGFISKLLVLFSALFGAALRWRCTATPWPCAAPWRGWSTATARCAPRRCGACPFWRGSGTRRSWPRWGRLAGLEIWARNFI